MWFYLSMGIFFIFLGLAVHKLKWYFLISGYNTMSKEKKANVDTAGLGRLMGIYCYVNSSVFLAVGVLQAWGLKPVVAPAMVFFGIWTVYFLLKAQKYDGNIYDVHGQLRQGAWKQLALPMGIMVSILISVAVLLFFSAQPTRVTLLDEGLQIHGMYGDVYPWDAIESVELRAELPTIEMRTNGSALGANLKGHFRTRELGSVKLLVNSQKPPFIYLKTEDGITIFNLKQAAETRALCSEILRRRE